MKLSIDNNSVLYLREFAKKIPLAIQNISSDTNELMAIYDGLKDSIGPHGIYFSEMLNSIKRAERYSEEVIEEIARKLNITADKIEAYLNNRIYSEHQSPHLDFPNSDIIKIEEKNYAENKKELRDPTLLPEQLTIIQEMENNGEMDIMPSEMGVVKTGGEYKRTARIDVDLQYNPDASYDVESFIEQVQFQEDGMNALTVSSFLKNYEKRNENGRSCEGTREQARYNDGLEVSIIDEKQESGLSLQKAKKEATEELRGKAALHNPDQIAGGTPSILSAKGDASVNSALGSLWNHGRAEKLYKRVAKMAENMTEKEKNMTYLNVRFNIYSK